MKTFIYFSQGEWRTFQAEELPIKPRIKDYVDMSLDLPSNEFYNDMQQYESEIAALKAKSLKVGNPEILVEDDKMILLPIGIFGMRSSTAVENEKFYQWPGTVEVKEELEYPIDHTSYPPYIEVGILKLP